MKQDTMNIKEWADNKFKEHKKDIEMYIINGLSPKNAFHLIMDSSTLGAGYRAQMKRDFNLSIFD